MKHSAIQQYDYHKWANEKVFAHLETLPPKVYGRKIKSVFESVSEVIFHIYQTDGMWLSVMSGDAFDKTMEVIKELEQKAGKKTLQRMKELYQELAGQYEAFFGKKDPDEVISIEHPRFGARDLPVAELVKHVVNHGTYHRGNITAMLRQQGHAGVPTDYIFYLYSLS